jgi:hypothetical protein
VADELDRKMEELGRQLGLGGLGTYSQGKLDPHDEGDIRMAVTNARGRVLVNFGKPVTWFGLTPEEARALATLLLKHADQAGA